MFDVRIDDSKCTTPFLCKKCVLVCPHKIFLIGARTQERYKETDPSVPNSFILRAIYRDQCMGCKHICQSVCPNSAIDVFPFVPKKKD
ncbi:MAG: hypothetical protein WC749_02860 [Dehalococcoidia bacterium]